MSGEKYDEKIDVLYKLRHDQWIEGHANIRHGVRFNKFTGELMKRSDKNTDEKGIKKILREFKGPVDGVDVFSGDQIEEVHIPYVESPGMLKIDGTGNLIVNLERLSINGVVEEEFIFDALSNISTKELSLSGRFGPIICYKQELERMVLPERVDRISCPNTVEIVGLDELMERNKGIDIEMYGIQ